MSPSSRQSILRREAIGFSLIILAAWAAEIVGLPHNLYGEPAEFNWARVLMRTFVIAAIWAWVYFATRRLLRRLHHLEEFMLICSWCRKVGQHGEWLSLEEYFGSNFDTKTSHGICPDCSRKAHDHLAQKIAEAGGDSGAVETAGAVPALNGEREAR